MKAIHLLAPDSSTVSVCGIVGVSFGHTNPLSTDCYLCRRTRVFKSLLAPKISCLCGTGVECQVYEHVAAKANPIPHDDDAHGPESDCPDCIVKAQYGKRDESAEHETAVRFFGHYGLGFLNSYGLGFLNS